MAKALPSDAKTIATWEIMETMDYGSLYIPSFNRRDRDELTKTAAYKSLKMRIAKDGQNDPIIVARDGGIAAGATRFQVCRDLGIPVKFIMFDKDIDSMKLQMLDAGLTTKKWTALDNAHFWREWGCQVYGDILDVVDMSKISISHMGKISQAAGMANIAIGSDEFKYGHQPKIDKDTLERYAMAIAPVIETGKFSSVRTIVNIFKWLVNKESFEKAEEIFGRVALKARRLKSKVGKDATAAKFESLAKKKGCPELGIPASIVNH